MAAVETAGDVAPLVEKLRTLQARRTAIDAEVTTLRPVPRLAPAVIESRLAEWRRLLRSSITQGRTDAATHPARAADVYSTRGGVS